jgi:hypothetical protein
MIKTYLTQTQTQAQNHNSADVLNYANIAFDHNSLISNDFSGNKPQSKSTFYNQRQRLQAYKHMNKRARKLYFLQVFMYANVGIGNTKDFSKEYIMEWIYQTSGYQIKKRSLTLYLNDLVDSGYLEVNQTYYRNPLGQIIPGNNNYTLLDVDPNVRLWSEDKPFKKFSPARKKIAHIPSTSFLKKEERRTISSTTSFSSDDSLVAEQKKPPRIRRPKIIDPMTWWPKGSTLEFLNEQVGPSYLQQEGIIEEYRQAKALQYPDGISEHEMSYQFFPHLKTKIILRKELGNAYIPLHRRCAFKKSSSNPPSRASAYKSHTEQIFELPKKTPYTQAIIHKPVERVNYIDDAENDEIADMLDDFYRRNDITDRNPKKR